MTDAERRTPWLGGIASRSVAAGIFWWLVVTSWFWWVTLIFLVGAIVSSALVVGFILGWRHDRARVG